MSQITFLHLTDLHRGQSGERSRWPPAREAVLKNMQDMKKKHGSPDLILFTGDLTFSGQQGEFELADQTLEEVRGAVGGDPILIPVPGNHDLVRRPKKDPSAGMFLPYFDEKTELRKNLIKAEKPTLQRVQEIFQNYEEWWDRSVKPSWEEHRLTYYKGLLPGDFLVTVEKDGFRLGIAALNSAFLQQTDRDYERQLAVEPEQLLPTEIQDIPTWCREHDAAFLIMHHPREWLHKEAIKVFEREIYHPEWFAACLFGHMHESRTLTEEGASGKKRRFLQGSSLFGLEHYGKNQEKRAMGYAWGRIEKKIGSKRGELTYWPQRGKVLDDGVYTVHPEPGKPRIYKLELPERQPQTRTKVGIVAVESELGEEARAIEVACKRDPELLPTVLDAEDQSAKERLSEFGLLIVLLGIRTGGTTILAEAIRRRENAIVLQAKKIDPGSVLEEELPAGRKLRTETKGAPSFSTVEEAKKKAKEEIQKRRREQAFRADPYSVAIPVRHHYVKALFEQYEAQNKEANQLFEGLFFQEALRKYQDLLTGAEALAKKDPENPTVHDWVARCHLNVGACLCLTGEVDKARQLFLKIPAENLTPAQRITLAINLSQVGEPETARALLPIESEEEEVLEARQIIALAEGKLPENLSPDPWVRVSACHLLLPRGELPSAVGYATAAMESAPNDTRLQIAALGVLVETLNRLYWEEPYPLLPIPEEERGDLVQKIESSFAALSGSSLPFVEKAVQELLFRYTIITYDHERHEETARWFERTGQQAPPPLESPALVVKLAKEGKIEEALQEFDLPDHPWQRRYHQAVVFGVAKKNDRALEELLPLAGEYPGRAPIEIQISELLLQAGRAKEALHHARLSFQALPGRGQRLVLARGLLACREFQEALDVLTPLSDSEHPEVLANRARALEEVRPGEAPGVWKSFLEKDPAHAEARLRLALLLYRLGERQEAAEEAWKAATSEGAEALEPGDIDQCIRLQGSDGKTARERKITLLKQLRERFPENADAERIYFEHWYALSEPGEIPAPDIKRAEEAGFIQKLSTKEIKEWFARAHVRRNSLWSAYHLGSLSLEFLAKEEHHPLAYLLQIILHSEGVIEAPLWRQGKAPEFFEGMELLTGELELLLLGHLGLLPSLQREIAPKGKLLLFDDVLDTILRAPLEVERFSEGDVTSDYQKLQEILSSSPKVNLLADSLNADDLTAALKERCSYVYEDPLPEEATRIAPYAFLLWLQEEGHLEPARLKTLLEELPTDREGISALKDRLMLSAPLLFRLSHAGLLGDILRALPGFLFVGPESARVIRSYADGAGVARETKESADTLHQWVGKGQGEGWIQLIRRPALDELPPLRDKKRWEGLRRGLQLALSWKKALLGQPARRLLSADHLTTALFDGGYPAPLLREFAWNPETARPLLEGLSSVTPQMMSFTELVRSFATTESEETSGELLTLARLGFLGALRGEDLVRLSKQYSGLQQKAKPQEILDHIEYQAKQQGHSGAPLTNFGLSLLYAQAIWIAFRSAKEGEDPSQLATYLLERLESLERRGIPGRLDDCFWWFLAQVRTDPRAFVERRGERFFFSQETSAGRLWCCLAAWTKGHPGREAAFDRAARDALISLDAGSESEEPQDWWVDAVQEAIWEVTPRYTHRAPMSLALRAAAILSAHWLYRPMEQLEIPATQEAEEPSGSTTIEALLTRAAESLTSPPARAQRMKPEGRFWLSLPDGKEADCVFPLEAVLLRASPEIIAKINPVWLGGYAARDGRLFSILKDFLESPEDPEHRRRLALAAATASWAEVREDPTVILQWGRLSPPFENNRAFPSNIDDLRLLLSEPGPLPEEELREVLKHRISEGEWSSDRDLAEVFWQAVEIPGGLTAWRSRLSPDVDEVARGVARVFQRLGSPHEETSAGLAGDIIALRVVAAEHPVLRVEDKEIDLKRRLPEAIIRALRSVLEEPPPESLAAAEVALLRICARVVARLSDPLPLPMRDGLWLTYRLFQWLVAHLKALPEERRKKHLRTLMDREGALPSITSEVNDALHPRWFGRGRFDQRLASLLYALFLGEFISINFPSPGEEGKEDIPNAWSDPLEKLLISLAERPFTEEEKVLRALPSPPSIVEWSLPTAVPDLALLVMLKLRPASILSLSKEARWRWLSQIFKAPKDWETLPDLVVAQLLTVLTGQVGRLEEDERALLGQRLLEPQPDGHAEYLRRSMLFFLFRAGETSLRAEVRGLVEEAIGRKEGPEFFGHYLISLSFQAPDRLEDEARQLLQKTEPVVEDPVLYLLEIEKLIQEGDPRGGAAAIALLREFSKKPFYGSDPRVKILLQKFGARQEEYLRRAEGPIIPLSLDLDNPESAPYFLWDDPMTVGELKVHLADAPFSERIRLLGKILREANDRDVWKFTSPEEVKQYWDDLAPHLGRRQKFWELLLARWQEVGLLGKE